jgi:hypothetical protein
VGIGELRALLLADGRQGRHESPPGNVQDREGSQRAGALPVLHDGSEVTTGQKYCARAWIDRCSALMNLASSEVRNATAFAVSSGSTTAVDRLADDDVPRRRTVRGRLHPAPTPALSS